MSRSSSHQSERASVIAEVTLLLRRLRRTTADFEPALFEHARSLQPRTAALGYGGIQVHLEAAFRSWEAKEQAPLLSRLEILEQLVGQATEELSSVERSAVEEYVAREENAQRSPSPKAPLPPEAVGPESFVLEPPPLLSLGHSFAVGPPSQEPPGLPGLGGATDSSRSPERFPESAHSQSRGEPHFTEAHQPRRMDDPLAPASLQVPPPIAPASVAAASGVSGHQRPVPTPGAVLRNSWAPTSEPDSAKAKPAFAVRSMFGLKASSAAPPAQAPAAAAPPVAQKEALFAPAPVQPGPALHAGQPHPSKPDQPASLFGLAARNRSRPLAPPPLVADPNGLPALSEAHPEARSTSTAPSALASHDMKQRLERIKQGGASSTPDSPVNSRKPPEQVRSRRRRSTQGPSAVAWTIAAVAGGGLILLSVVAFLVLRSEPRETALPSEPVVAVATASTGPDQPASAPGLTVPEERFNELLRSVHGHGGQASPELSALLDEQAAIARQALQPGKCEDSTEPHCAAWGEMREALLGSKPIYVEKRQRSTTRPRWMEGLRLPQIRVEDDTRVKQVFEFFTQNPVGRARIQKMLFRCGAYQDLIRSTLERLELPLDLQAVVFAESGCNPTALSPAGAAGLWQFMPATARAYHLRVEEDVVDERLNPFKSTEAAVRLLLHLHQKLGDWELALASYNLGPFGVLSRVERAGGNVGFWDLVDADLMPEETANYVPTIQAIALILRNLRSLKFAGTQMRAPQLTADLQAPGGTRLSLIARAASTSRRELQKLNPDIVGELVPSLENGFAVQVPKDVVWQARDTLKALLAQNNQDDLCVSPDFDWGSQEFTESMAKACHRKLKASPR